MPNFGYHFARLIGSCSRGIYAALLPLIVQRRIKSPRKIDIEIFAYSGEAMLPEQVASIRSFLRYVGTPKKFTVVSDGSYSARSISLLQAIDPIVSVRAVSNPPSDQPAKFRDYLANHATGKQLALIMSLPADGPAIYMDSDVRFFAGADDLLERIRAKDATAFYLADCQFAGDERLIKSPAERTAPVNTGFLILFRKLDWAIAADRFSELCDSPIFFTNQTLTHLVMHQNAARPLEPAKYVLQLSDQFTFGDRFAGDDVVLRHYVNPVRHKFWTSLTY